MYDGVKFSRYVKARERSTTRRFWEITAGSPVLLPRPRGHWLEAWLMLEVSMVTMMKTPWVFCCFFVASAFHRVARVEEFFLMFETEYRKNFLLLRSVLPSHSQSSNIYIFSRAGLLVWSFRTASNPQSRVSSSTSTHVRLQWISPSPTSVRVSSVFLGFSL